MELLEARPGPSHLSRSEPESHSGLWGRASLAMRLKERWVQSLLDRRAANATNDMMANRQVDQLLLPLSSALSWLIVLVPSSPSCPGPGLGARPQCMAWLHHAWWSTPQLRAGHLLDIPPA